MPRWLPLLLLFILVGYIVYLADTRSFPLWFYRMQMDWGVDKIGHFALMGGLAWCANDALGWRQWRVGSMALWTGSWVIFVLVALEEASQHWIPGRNCDWRDLLADFLGILVAGRLAPRSVGAS